MESELQKETSESNSGTASIKRRRNRRKKSQKSKLEIKAEVELDESDPNITEENSYIHIENTVLLDNNCSDKSSLETTMEKSKDEIKAEREAKKLSKKMAKVNLKDGSQNQKADNSNKQKESQENKDDSRAEKSTILSPSKHESSNVNTGTGIPEKSRDEIKAEREAKKQAKKAQKNKTSDEKQSESHPEICILKDVVKKAEKIQHFDEKGSESQPQVSVSKDVTKKAEKIKNSDEKGSESPPKGPVSKDVTNSADSQSKTSTEKSKAELKAERRAKQEAQRAAKAAMKTTEKIEKPKSIPVTSLVIKKANTPEKVKPKILINHHKVKLFNHLYSEKDRKISIPLNSKEIHRAVVRLGVQYSSHIIIGSNARCIALLNAIKEVVRDYSLPPNVEFSRGFEAHLAPCIKFLNSCRPMAVSMHNAYKQIKWQLTQLPNSTSESEGKAKLYEAIDVYIKDQIDVAGKAISIAVKNKITNDNVILTYGCSSLIEHILVDAAKEKTFRVVVVEAHPWNEGREMLRRLTSKGIKCSLVMISALSFVMREINKVVLGAGALLANGYVMARAGTAQVAMVAHAHNVPVLVCCETHKFSERVQTDSFVYNEIGDPDDLINCDSLNMHNRLSNWRTFNTLTPLNLFYDVTPPDLVTAVVTELAILPCTSVPVILRIKPSEFM